MSETLIAEEKKDYLVADITQADFGRREIEIAVQYHVSWKL